MTTPSSTATAPAHDEWLETWSAYVDRFLAGRSVLSSALFASKPAQMWFGYEFTVPVLENITAWLRERVEPEAFGESLRRPCAPAVGLHLMAVTWSYTFGTLGRILDGDRADRERVVDTLDFWRRAYSAYVTRVGPTEVLGEADTPNLVLAEADVEALAQAVRAPGDLNVQKLAGALANYSWLLECESRQGVFAHGLYPTGSGTLLVREFGDLSGAFYPWMPEEAVALPAGPLAVAIALDHVPDAAFDAFGVARITPEAYGPHVVGVAVATSDGLVDDPVAWLTELEPRLGKAHKALYRVIARWSRREQFIGGARSYARLWAALVTAGGGAEDDRQRLVLNPFEAACDEPLERHLALEGPASLWQWAGSSERPTIFTPILDAVRE